MIELIFAITIMGIVVMSIPMLIKQSTASSYVALQQESIAAAAVQVNTIMTTAWDYWDTNATIGEPVLKTVSMTFGQCTGGATTPKGVTAASGRYCLGLGGPPISYSATPYGSFGTEGNEGISYDDVDDFDQRSYTIKVYHGENYPTYMGDYIDTNITVTSRIYYSDDTPRLANGNTSPTGFDQTTTFSNPFRDLNTTPANVSTNIKIISVTLSSQNPAEELKDKNITLSAFMCNIGAPKKILSNEGSL
jgi:hypothetical protein